MAIDYESSKRDIAQLLAELKSFPDHVEVTPHTNANTLFLRVSWMVHGQGEDRQCVPIRFAIDGRVIDVLTKQDPAQRKLFEEHFLRFVNDRMRGYNIESGMPSISGHASTFDIIIDEDDLKPFYDDLKKLPRTLASRS